MKTSPGPTNLMTECPLEHLAGFPWPKKEPVGNFDTRHAKLRVRGRQVLDRLLVLLSSQLDSQPTSRVSPFPPTLLFSICDILQANHDSAEQIDPGPFVLPSVLSTLRAWRLLDPDYRYSLGGIHRLALDLAAITDEASPSTHSDLNRASHARLRVKWVPSQDSPRESQVRESSSPPPPSPSSSRSGIVDSAQTCARVLPDLNKYRSDAGHELWHAGRLDTPGSEDAGSVVSSRHRSVSGFRNGCSACRHPRLSGSTSTPPSPHVKPSVLFNDVGQFDVNISTSVPLVQCSTSSTQHTPRKPRRERHKASSSQSITRGVYVDENEPPPSKPPVVQQGIGVSFPRQRTHSPRISNAILSREPFSPPAASASVQRRREPSHPVHQARQGDKRTTSHRLASVDLRLSMVNPRPDHASPDDLHPPNAPTRAHSLSYTPDTSRRSHGVKSAGAVVPKLSSNAVQSQSSKRLPSWTRTHPPMTTSLTPTGSMAPTPAKAGRVNIHLLPLGAWSRPSSASIPPSLPNDVKHRDRPSASSKTHKHTSSVPILPFSPASPLIHARRWQT